MAIWRKMVELVRSWASRRKRHIVVRKRGPTRRPRMACSSRFQGVRASHGSFFFFYFHKVGSSRECYLDGLDGIADWRRADGTCGCH